MPRRYHYLVGHETPSKSYSTSIAWLLCALTHSVFVYATYPDSEQYPTFNDTFYFLLYEFLMLVIAAECGFVIYHAIPEFTKALAFDAELIHMGFRYFVPEKERALKLIPYVIDEEASDAMTARLQATSYEDDIPNHLKDIRTFGLISTPVRLIVKNKFAQLEAGHIIDIELYRFTENEALINQTTFLCPVSRQPIMGYKKDGFAQNQIELWLQTLEKKAGTFAGTTSMFNISKYNYAGVPIKFCDPLDQELMQNPIKLIITLKNKNLAFGCTLDKRSLDILLKKRDPRCPLTKQFIAGYGNDYFMAEEIEEYKKSKIAAASEKNRVHNNDEHVATTYQSSNLFTTATAKTSTAPQLRQMIKKN